MRSSQQTNKQATPEVRHTNDWMQKQTHQQMREACFPCRGTMRCIFLESKQANKQADKQTN
jgi:hypothetical protein